MQKLKSLPLFESPTNFSMNLYMANVRGKIPIKNNFDYKRKCTTCLVQETCIAVTLFNKCKSSILKTFWIVYDLFNSIGGVRIMELQRILDYRQKTCRLFNQAVMQRRKCSKQHPMSGKVEVDEVVAGHKEKDVKARELDEKKNVIIAVKHVFKGISRIYPEVPDKYSKAEIQLFIDHHVSKKLEFILNKWTAYKNVKDKFPNHKLVFSEGGNFFNFFHRSIIMIKALKKDIPFLRGPCRPI